MTKLYLALLVLVLGAVAWAAAPKASAQSIGIQSLTPVPFPRFAEPVEDGGANPVTHFNGVIYNDTRGCMQVTAADGGTRQWDCVATRADIPPPYDAGTPAAPTPGTQMARAATAPALPAAQAAQNMGQVFLDTTQGCFRATRNGVAWGDCLTTQVCTNVSVSGISIPLAGLTTTSTISFPGALAGRDCTITPPSFLPLGAKAVCKVAAAGGSVDYRWEAGGPLALALAIPTGTHRLCTEVLW